MVDPYAIVRRLTGHELISPKDARLLTEAVDGMIGEIGSKDARIAELEAEVERLTKERDYWQSQHDERTRQLGQSDAEALSHTGAVKVKALEWERENADGTVHYADSVLGEYSVWEIDGFGYWSHGGLAGRVTDGGLTGGKAAAQADYERRILSALEATPSATLEAQLAEARRASITEAEVEAAREAWREYWSDVIGQYEDDKGPMEGMRRALEAARRVREEGKVE